MATITEDYVSFEIAKLLKEKGFMEGAIVKFFASGYDSKGNILDIRDTELKDYPRPTLQMAIKWLREVHNIAIVVTPSMFWGKYNVSIYKKGNDYPIGFDGYSLISSYERACEAAIKYCLENLI